MKKAILFYFSGTGNTERVAGMIRDELTHRSYQVDVVRIEDILKKKLAAETASYDLIGIGCQVIGFGVPGIVKKFARKLPEGNGKRLFVFRTAGGVVPRNFNASKPLIRLLKRKGYDVFHERLFGISSNWIVRFDDEVVRGLYSATQKKVGQMCEALDRGEEHFYKTGAGLRMQMGLISTLSKPFFRLTGKDHKVGASCTHCGMCVRNCPAGNIRMSGERVKFGFKCNSCMRCLYSCPSKAIRLGFFKFFRVPGEYDLKRILAGETVNPVKGAIPPYYEKYVKNDESES